jgi:hypothetical protein
MSTGIYRLIENAQNRGGAAAFIAILITITLCVVFAMHPDNSDVGKTLTYALTTIFGFYFGTVTGHRDKTD